MTHDDPTRKVRQYIGVRGQSRELVESAAPNLASARRDATADTLILRGDGLWFPPIGGDSWAALCDKRRPDDLELSDLTPILRLLLDATVLPVSDATPAEIEAWLHTVQGAVR